MLVTLIGKNILYKTKLPNKQAGNYWITDDDGKKILNMKLMMKTKSKK